MQKVKEKINVDCPTPKQKKWNKNSRLGRVTGEQKT